MKKININFIITNRFSEHGKAEQKINRTLKTLYVIDIENYCDIDYNSLIFKAPLEPKRKGCA